MANADLGVAAQAHTVNAEVGSLSVDRNVAVQFAANGERYANATVNAPVRVQLRAST